MYVRTDTGIKSLSFSEFKKNRDKYAPMTVSEVMSARQFDPQLTGNTRVFSIAENSIGVQKITDHVQHMMGILSELSSTTERHYSRDQLEKQYKALTGTKPTEEVTASINRLQEVLNTPGEYFKIESQSTTKRGAVDTALNYI
jgi:hypothetical protein